jgi:beta-glucosidase
MDMPGGLGEYGLAGGPDSYFGGNVTSAVSNGTIEESRLDDMIERIMTPFYYLGQDQDYPTVDPSGALTGPSSRDVRGNHGELIRKLGAASAVLLKNVNNTLPLQAPKSIGVFGNDASEDVLGFYNQNDFEYGTLSVGGGSGTGRLTYLVTPLEALKVRAAQDGTLIQQFLNNNFHAYDPTRSRCLYRLPQDLG